MNLIVTSCGLERSVRNSSLLRKLETDIRAGADSHQSQQSRAELGHRQLIVDRGNKDHPEDKRPREDLKAMKAVAAPVAEQVAQKPSRYPGRFRRRER